eukprot:scaffold27208_cov46-Phaeocystis_antarctica.AAC.1
MVRTPAPRDHPPAFVRNRLPRAPETSTPSPAARPGGKDCMEGDDGAPKIPISIAICESREG